MNVKCKTTLLAVAIAAIIGSVVVATAMFPVVAYAGSEDRRGLSEGVPANLPMEMRGRGMGRGFPPVNCDQIQCEDLVISAEEAQNTVSGAIAGFAVGDITGRGSLWIVSIEYNGEVVTRVPLGKINTPTEADAIGDVQASIGSWVADEPKQFRCIYNVPIIDANTNTIGNIRVDGTTGDIITGFPMLRR